MTRAYQRLDDALAEGYCLHGSTVSGLATIEPRQAWCKSGGKDQCQKAVYASQHGVRVPLVHACVIKLCDDVRYHQTSYEANTDEEPLLVTGYNVTLGFGSVYILRRNTFRQHGDEFISYSPVPVVEEVFVGPATLLHIRHDYDLRIPVPHPWR